jgi:AAA+ ATPase superfamily predicted ATPase
MPNGALVDREDEVERLRAMAADEGRSMALVYGRRRIGKTYLLTHAWEDEEVLYFTASATSPEINRRALLREASAWSGEELRPEDHPTWRTVFRAVFGLRGDVPIVVVLDEFQYLATDDDGLREVASELNAVWEGRLNRDAGLLLVLSGSAVHALRALESGGSPLFGRLDWRRRLPPFDYFDAGRMVPWDARSCVETYAAFGGTPKYLDAIDRDRSLEDNIVDLALSPDGKVRMQVETALEQEEGFRDSSRYRAILASVGLKRRTLGDVAASLGESADPALRRMVKRLVELEYLEEEKNFEAPRNQAKRYRLADPAQRFYYGLVLPNESAIASAGPERVWKERLSEEAWLTYVGFEVFEDVARQGYARHADAAGLPAVESWGRWQGKDRARRDIEVDVVARLLDRRIMSGEVKYRRRPCGARLLLDHRHALERLADSGQAFAHDALQDEAVFFFVSAAGFKESFFEVAEEVEQQVVAWSLEDLYHVHSARHA